MNKTLYFIAGLPRSGSTLLSALLNQNPRFYSGPSSPVLPAMQMFSNFIDGHSLFRAYPKVKQIENYVRDFIKYYYAEVTHEVIFEKNRAWTGNISTIEYYFKVKPKLICMVRDIAEIYTSLQKNVIRFDEPLLSKKDHILYEPYNKLQKAFTEHKDMLYIVEYNDLVLKPKETMQSIYSFLNEDYYPHYFTNIKQKYKELDEEVYEIKDMHKVKSNIIKSITKPTQDIIDKCKDMEFWR